MTDLKLYIKEINKLDIEDICSCWKWRLTGQKEVILVSSVGDIFLIGNDGEINWLDTSVGQIKRIADDIQHFNELLNDFSNVDNWLLATLVDKKIKNGIMLKENEVYSFKIFPILGGEYSVENLEPTDISVHFALTGQLHENIKDIPDGTKINYIKFDKE
jgi:hypothetical protein